MKTLKVNYEELVTPGCDNRVAKKCSKYKFCCWETAGTVPSKCEDCRFYEKNDQEKGVR